MDNTFITCAVTGAGDGFKRNPNVPITPDEIVASAIAAADAGTAIVHLHVRDPKTGEGSRDDALYQRAVERIRDQNREVIINLTTGMSGDAVFGSNQPILLLEGTDFVGPANRSTHVEKLRPDICTLDCGSHNVGDSNRVYISTSDYIRTGAKQIATLGVRPELESFDLGHFRFALKLLSEYVFASPVMIQFCPGALWHTGKHKCHEGNDRYSAGS